MAAERRGKYSPCGRLQGGRFSPSLHSPATTSDSPPTSRATGVGTTSSRCEAAKDQCRLSMHCCRCDKTLPGTPISQNHKIAQLGWPASVSSAQYWGARHRCPCGSTASRPASGEWPLRAPLLWRKTAFFAMHQRLTMRKLSLCRAFMAFCKSPAFISDAACDQPITYTTQVWVRLLPQRRPRSAAPEVHRHSAGSAQLHEVLTSYGRSWQYKNLSAPALAC